MNYGPVILGISVTILLALIALFIRAGHVIARVESLEKWRDSIPIGHIARIDELERWRSTIRQDMHEISDILTKMSGQMLALETLLRERTERRGEQAHWPEHKNRRQS